MRDKTALARIQARLTRLEGGNPGDFKALGAGIYEMRLMFGPGYRIYFGRVDEIVVVLLCGGDKSTQQKDIEKARHYWQDFLENQQ